MPQKQLRKYVVFMAKMTLLTIKSKIGFQSFILTMSMRDETLADLDQDALKKLVPDTLNLLLPC